MIAMIFSADFKSTSRIFFHFENPEISAVLTQKFDSNFAQTDQLATNNWQLVYVKEIYVLNPLLFCCMWSTLQVDVACIWVIQQLYMLKQRLKYQWYTIPTMRPKNIPNNLFLTTEPNFGSANQKHKISKNFGRQPKKKFS